MSQDSKKDATTKTIEQSFPLELPKDPSRRNWIGATCAIGGAATVAALVPFVGSMLPSERAKAAGAPVTVNISDIAPGEMRTVEWQGKPVWIIRRTTQMLNTLKSITDRLADPNSKRPGFTPAFANNEFRSRKQEWLVVVGICTHLGCSPSSFFTEGDSQGMSRDWPGGFLCPCHGSQFDLAGRVFKNQPAPDNLLVPPYYFIDDSNIMIGLEKPAA